MFGLPKLYLYIAAAVLVCGLAYKAVDWIGDARETKVHHEYALKLEAEKERVSHAEENARKISQTADTEIQSLRSQLADSVATVLAHPTPGGIRLCKQSSDTSGAARTASSPSEPTDAPERIESPVRAGADIERELVQFAERAENDRLTVIAWQAWYAAQSAEWVK